MWRMQRESKNRSEQKRLFFLLKLPAIRFLLLFLHFVIFRLEMRTEPTTYNLLSTITFPEDLRQLSVEELPEVCKELRQDIIKEVSCNPGHFAASLGTVELTVALHYVFNTPYDRIVWDVGHQAYGHKILTGRREAFSTNIHLRTCVKFNLRRPWHGCCRCRKRRERPPCGRRHR